MGKACQNLLAAMVLLAVIGGRIEIVSAGAEPAASPWCDRVLAFPYADAPLKAFGLQLIRQDFEQLERGRSVIQTPLRIGGRSFGRGLGTHAVSRIRVLSPEPIERFSAWVGVDNNERTEGRRGSVVFAVLGADEADTEHLTNVLWRSAVLRGGQEAARVDLDTAGATALELRVEDGGDGPGWDHADWAEAAIRTRSEKRIDLDDLKLTVAPWRGSAYPFSFVYGGKSSDELLRGSKPAGATNEGAAQTTQSARTWTDPQTGLRVEWEAIRYADFPALEWVLRFENTSARDSLILEEVQALDLTLDTPLSGAAPYRLHRAKGAPSDPTDFEPATVVLKKDQTERLSAGGGRSSNRDFPFFKVETGAGSLITAVGWSGQWLATLHCPDGHHVRLKAGLERTHFKLLPGEKVRSPRMLVMFREGDTLESNAEFRQLIYRHYAARRSGRSQLPTIFCNSCFTRGGGWLNECNASNQISLIKAYGPLGLEALITDAGWFEGGWPEGAGNWTPRRDAYPQGMGPVAAAAQARDMVYGLWFEPERVVAGTGLHRQHPAWVLTDGQPGQGTFLADFGLREVQDYFFNIVKGFMALPGFRFYRQDFNMDPLGYWRHHDPPDRQGITELKYIEGLYAYWDRLAAAWPDSLREECASGGRRIDLETLRRMPLHQKSDYWFDSDVDQASLWTLSQYLPNNLITVPINKLDDYAFHSALASSLIPGWIADEPGFDTARAKKLLDRYRAVRHLLVGAWYPLLPYSRSPRDWMAVQFHRPELQEGMILCFRRAESPYRTAEVGLHGLDAKATYQLTFDSGQATREATGAELMRQWRLTLPQARRSDLIVYRRGRSGENSRENR